MVTSACFLALAFAAIKTVSGQSAAEELQFSQEDQIEFDKFKDAAQNLIPPTMNQLFKSDLALAKIFRNARPDKNSKFTGAAATTLLNEIIAFRDKAGVDRYNKSAMGFVPLEFPFTLGKNHDLLGNPILFFQGARWRYYKAIQEGNREKLVAHMYNVCEQGFMLTMKTTGRYFLLIDSINIDFMNFRPEVAAWMRETSGNNDRMWPRTIGKFVFINVPSFFTVVCDLIKGLLHPETAENFVAFGTDSSLWHPHLLKYISPEEIPSKIEVPKTAAAAAPPPPAALPLPFFG